MKFTTAFSALALAIASTTSFVAAAPIEARDIWDPKVLYPHSGTVWKTGSYHNVTWDTSNPPPQVSNGAAVYLRKGPSTFIDQPLAQGFDLHTGHVEVQVPTNLTAGTDYRIVCACLISFSSEHRRTHSGSFTVFGDSGNWGPEFTIVKT
ncbi:hypothetical protein OF83DRAFT_495507 [Amylostereum chailletii]|nr:hypothetical protein OF83DRAFT_495507 [Amylostereum chailletii]